MMLPNIQAKLMLRMHTTSFQVTTHLVAVTISHSSFMVELESSEVQATITEVHDPGEYSSTDHHAYCFSNFLCSRPNEFQALVSLRYVFRQTPNHDVRSSYERTYSLNSSSLNSSR